MALTEQAEAILRQRKQTYTEFFDSPGGRMLLGDLERFCRANETTFHPDARVAANLDGRREVWLRLQHHLQLNIDTLWKIYGDGT